MSSSVMGLPSHMSGFLYPLGPPSSGVYSYVSYPTVLPNSRPRYRNEQVRETQMTVISTHGHLQGEIFLGVGELWG